MKGRNTKKMLKGTSEENHGVESHKNLAWEEYPNNFWYLSSNGCIDMVSKALSTLF